MKLRAEEPRWSAVCAQPLGQFRNRTLKSSPRVVGTNARQADEMNPWRAISDRNASPISVSVGHDAMLCAKSSKAASIHPSFGDAWRRDNTAIVPNASRRRRERCCSRCGAATTCCRDNTSRFFRGKPLCSERSPARRRVLVYRRAGGAGMALHGRVRASTISVPDPLRRARRIDSA